MKKARIYDVVKIHGVEIKYICASDGPTEVAKYKCPCSVLIKNKRNLHTHFQSKSHFKNLEWLASNRPTGQFLRPYHTK